MLLKVISVARNFQHCGCRLICGYNIGAVRLYGKHAPRIQFDKLSNEKSATTNLFESAQEESFGTSRKGPAAERNYRLGTDEFGVPGIEDPTLNVLLPSHETHRHPFDGIPFEELPVAHIRSTKNNTLINVCEPKGGVGYANASGGTVGFKNSAKGTDVAAQTAGYAVGQRLKRSGIKSVRVVLSGLGKGRESSVLGMTLAGVKIISITDTTISDSPLRPRKRPRK